MKTIILIINTYVICNVVPNLDGTFNYSCYSTKNWANYTLHTTKNLSVKDTVIISDNNIYFKRQQLTTNK